MRRALLLSLAAGPLTGPLAYGVLRCLRARRWAMAGWYALGLAEVVVGLPWLLRVLLAHVQGGAA